MKEVSATSDIKSAPAIPSGRPVKLQSGGVRIPAAIAFGLILIRQICVVCMSARSHPFWYDELITDFLSALPSFSRKRGSSPGKRGSE